jgi:hypothetical protein
MDVVKRLFTPYGNVSSPTAPFKVSGPSGPFHLCLVCNAYQVRPAHAIKHLETCSAERQLEAIYALIDKRPEKTTINVASMADKQLIEKLHATEARVKELEKGVPPPPKIVPVAQTIVTDNSSAELSKLRARIVELEADLAEAEEESTTLAIENNRLTNELKAFDDAALRVMLARHADIYDNIKAELRRETVVETKAVVAPSQSMNWTTDSEIYRF